MKVAAAPVVIGGEASTLDPKVRRSAAVAKVFLKHVPNQIASIGRAIENAEAATLKSAAHKLKGSSLAVGVPRMAQLCGQLEAGAPDPAALFNELRQVFERAQTELTAQADSKAAS